MTVSGGIKFRVCICSDYNKRATVAILAMGTALDYSEIACMARGTDLRELWRWDTDQDEGGHDVCTTLAMERNSWRMWQADHLSPNVKCIAATISNAPTRQGEALGGPMTADPWVRTAEGEWRDAGGATVIYWELWRFYVTFLTVVVVCPSVPFISFALALVYTMHDLTLWVMHAARTCLC